MAFSFFRKRDGRGGSRPASARPPKPVSLVGAEAATRRPVRAPEEYPSDAGGIEVMMGGEGVSQAAEHAAILFASGRPDRAAAALREEIAAGRRDPEPWFMLFDLLQVEGRREEFEALADDFMHRFERSAPMWQEQPPRPPARAASPALVVSLGRALTDRCRGKLGEAERATEAGREVRLELSHLESLRPEGCDVLLAHLQRARRAQRRVQAAGLDVLRLMLEQAIADPDLSRAPAVWLLLLEVYLLQSRPEEFELVSIDYAVQFEVSPPSWEGPAAAPASSDPLPRAPGSGEVYALSGAISGASVPQLDGLVAYSEGRDLVRVDFNAVTRVDWMSTSALLNALHQIRASGKQVVIEGANALVVALLAVVGVPRVATIARRKEH